MDCPSKYNGTQNPEEWLKEFRFFCLLRGIHDEHTMLELAMLKIDNTIPIPEEAFEELKNIKYDTEMKHKGQIRYGSRIALKHVVTGQYLSHGNKHKPDILRSNLSEVFCSGWKRGGNDVWVITAAYGQNKAPGDPISSNSMIQLVHEVTRESLFGDEGQLNLSGAWVWTLTDPRTNWIIQRHSTLYYDSPGYVMDCDIINLRHNLNKMTLKSHEFKNSAGHQEVIIHGDGQEDLHQWQIELVS
ncbi:unnamed protein product [Rhizophagus irregularis]|uniref:MIR domain-containing protein n=1 Tax=Rhizophagus irregularis TaxID=588596 RepID=A0A915YTP0_9GLOM|nr:unnamed protein product [Rhizophagus irregularis]